MFFSEVFFVSSEGFFFGVFFFSDRFCFLFLQKIITWNGKLNLPFDAKNAAEKRPSEPEADMEMRRWEKKSSERALYETHRELASQRLQLHRANQWADQAQREKINLCGDLEMRNRF